MLNRQDVQVRPGDIFCTRNPMWLGRAINAVQKFWSSDNESVYSHSGIIIDTAGTTLESLWTIREQNIEDAYSGSGVIIGRHKLMTRKAFEEGLKCVMKHKGQIYPFHRLIFHLFPPAAKYISTGGFPVCSELACKFLAAAGLLNSWKGKNPDHVADMIRRWRMWDIVFEGIL